MLQPINASFSRGITTAMGNATDNINSVGKLANDYILRARQDEETAYNRGRQKVLDDRATQLWNEQQTEKEKLASASLLAANERDTAAASSVNFDKAMQAAQAKGLDTGSMGAAGVLDWYSGQQPILSGVNINAVQPNITGGGGTRILAKQTPMPTGTVPQTKVVQPTNNFQLANFSKANIPNTEGVTYTDVPGSTDVSNTTRPSMSFNVPTTLAKEAKILPAKATPKDVTKAASAVNTGMTKILSSAVSGGAPKLNQVEASTIDKIFSSIDPNKVDRVKATSDLSSMLYSLGLNPAQVRDYTTASIESVYGDKNDPIALAMANAKVNAYSKNVDTANDLAKVMYTQSREDARHNASLAAQKAAMANKNDPTIDMWKTAQEQNQVIFKTRLDDANNAVATYRAIFAKDPTSDNKARLDQALMYQRQLIK